MRSRPALLGEAPGPRFGHVPFDGPSGRNLERLLGLAPGGIADAFECRNLLDYWPARWPRRDARAAALRLAPRLPAVVVLAGRRVADACGLADVPWYEWVEGDARHVAAIPHPSGLNRYWNEPANRARAAAFLHAAIAKADAIAAILDYLHPAEAA